LPVLLIGTSYKVAERFVTICSDLVCLSKVELPKKLSYPVYVLDRE